LKRIKWRSNRVIPVSQSPFLSPSDPPIEFEGFGGAENDYLFFEDTVHFSEPEIAEDLDYASEIPEYGEPADIEFDQVEDENEDRRELPSFRKPSDMYHFASQAPEIEQKEHRGLSFQQILFQNLVSKFSLSHTLVNELLKTEYGAILGWKNYESMMRDLKLRRTESEVSYIQLSND
jgi:hypothetical protein